MEPTDIIQEFSRIAPPTPIKGSSKTVQPAFAIDHRLAKLVCSVQQDADMDFPTLTKAELAELLVEKIGLNKREAKEMVEAFFVEISNALERGESVKLTGFGNFQLRDKASRPGRNPRTGVEVKISARRIVTFRPGIKLKSALK